MSAESSTVTSSGEAGASTSLQPHRLAFFSLISRLHFCYSKVQHEV